MIGGINENLCLVGRVKSVILLILVVYISLNLVGLFKNAYGRLLDPSRVVHFGGLDMDGGTFLESLELHR